MKGAKGKPTPSADKPPEDRRGFRAPSGKKVEVVIEKTRLPGRPPAGAKGKRPETERGPERREPTHEPDLPELPYKDVPPVKFAKRPVEPRVQPASTSRPVAGDKKNYELKAPVEDVDDDTEALIKDIFGSLEFSLPLGKLFALSPRLLRQAKTVLSRKRVPPVIRATLEQIMRVDNSFSGGTSEAGDPENSDEVVRDGPISIDDLPYNAAAEVTEWADGLVPAGSVVVSDPVVQYWLNLPEGYEAKAVYAAMAFTLSSGGDSACLRVVFPFIAGMAEVESILDGGSHVAHCSNGTTVEAVVSHS